MSKYPVVVQPTVHNNVRFKPPKKATWYRSKHGSRCTHSAILLDGGKRFSAHFDIQMAYFTWKRGDGYTAVLYKNGIVVACRELQNGNHIKTNNIASAEREALRWARNPFTM